MAASFKSLSSVEAFEDAYSLRGRVSERERLWIESQYCNITADYVSSLETSQRLVALYPDEAIFQRHLAFAFAASGRPHDALPHSQRAVELDPSSDNNLSELMANHAEANLNDEALARFQQFRA